MWTMDLVWIKGRGGEVIKDKDLNAEVRVMTAITRKEMVRELLAQCAQLGFPRLRLDHPDVNAHCLILRHKGRLYYLLSMAGTPEERLSLFVHEALHCVKDFSRGRRFPAGVDKEEHQCIMIEALVREYVRHEWSTLGNPERTTPTPN